MSSKIHWFAIRKDGLSYMQCLEAAIETPELIREFDRLNGTNLLQRGSGLELAIDKATGRLDHDMKLFCEFVWDDIFLRTPLAEPPKKPKK
jgi:hypothetical protein